MVSNDMSDDDSVIDPTEQPDESEDEEEAAMREATDYNDEEGADPYGSDAQEQVDEDEFAVPEAEDDETPDQAARPQEPSPAAKRAEKEPPKKDKGGGTSILAHFSKQNGASKEAAPSTPAARAPAAIKPVQPKVPLGAGRHKGGKAAAAAAAAPKAAARKAAAPAPKPKAGAAAAGQPEESSFSFNNESEDEEAPLTTSVAKNAGYGASIASIDAEQEYEDLRAEAAKSPAGGEAAQGAPPQVHESAKQRRYVMRNEKTKKWAEYLVEGFEYAPPINELFELSLEEITVSSKKERLSLHNKLADESMSKIQASLCIGKINVDGSGSGSGPGINNFMAAIPVEVPLRDQELADLLARMKEHDPATPTVMLLALDHDIVKRVFKVANSTLPAALNPNTNSGNKYKVPAKLEEQKDYDDNFAFLGTIEASKKQRGGKRPGEEAGAASSSRADAKRPATAAAVGAPAEDAEEAPVAENGTVCMKPVGDKEFKTRYAELRCGKDEQFTLVPAGPGQFLLVLSPA